MTRFSDKVAVVTGATSGIGSCIAKFLAEEGASVILTGRNEEKGKNLEQLIKETNKNCCFVKCDTTLEEDIIALKKIVEEQYGKINILINNAGIFITSPLEDIKNEDWNNTFETNITGCYLMTKHFMPMLIHSQGVILNNASIAGLQSYASGNSYMYSASKAALIQFTKICAKNYAKDVRVNCICPGIVDTPIFTNRDFTRFNDKVPMGRVATPEEIAKVALFMVSDEASYITGVALPIDGGVSL